MNRGEVLRVARCRLRAREGAWEYETTHADAIARYWDDRYRDNGNYFNGRVHVVEGQPIISDDCLVATLIEVSFASFVHWKDHGYPPANALDGFGSALIRSQDCKVVLARQSANNLNAGLVYMPGGFIDRRDVADDGSIDIDASIERELLEETGLSFKDFARRTGFVVTRLGHQLSIAIELRSELAGELLRGRLLAYAAQHSDGELADFVVVAEREELDRPDIVPFTRSAVQFLFAEQCAGERNAGAIQ